MGLSIYYSGKLKSPHLLPDLVDAVRDVVLAHNWKYDIFETVYPGKKFSRNLTDNLYGICFAPPGCEPVCLSFMSNGRLTTPWLFEYYFENGRHDMKPPDGASTKTQYAGADCHQLIIDLFRYLEKKYFSSFKMFDDSRYWESCDESVMRANFDRYDALMDNFALALDSTPIRKGETAVKYILRVMEQINKKRSD